MSADRLITVGWREWVALPALGLPAIKAKLDTGARTSTLHTFRLETFHHQGQQRVRFWVHPIQARVDIAVSCEAAVLDERVITSSGGHRESRWVIETNLRVASEEWPIELTLTNRDALRFRMLLARSALAGHVRVDPDQSYLLGRPQGIDVYRSYSAKLHRHAKEVQ